MIAVFSIFLSGMQSGGQQAGYPMHIVSPQQKTSVACFSPRFVCVAVLGLLALCLGRLVHALAALSVPVDVTHRRPLLLCTVLIVAAHASSTVIWYQPPRVHETVRNRRVHFTTSATRQTRRTSADVRSNIHLWGYRTYMGTSPEEVHTTGV